MKNIKNAIKILKNDSRFKVDVLREYYLIDNIIISNQEIIKIAEIVENNKNNIIILLSKDDNRVFFKYILDNNYINYKYDYILKELYLLDGCINETLIKQKEKYDNVNRHMSYEKVGKGRLKKETKEIIEKMNNYIIDNYIDIIYFS